MRQTRAALVTMTATVLLLSSCAETDPSPTGSSAAGSIVIGTTDRVSGLDPAGTWDLGSATLHNQVYRWLLTSKPGSTQPVPDLAKKAEFISPTQYRVKLRPDLKFANGHDLTASDVKFSFERMLKIADPNGPSQLLSDLKSVKTRGQDTVVFTLKSKNNVLWPQILTSPAAMILDEQVFPATKLADDAAIVDANAFAGPYSITSFSKNEVVKLTKNENYHGLLGPAKTETVTMKYYTAASDLKLDVGKGTIDVAYRTLGPTAIADLRKNDDVKVYTGPGAEMRFLVFDFVAMPYGSGTANPDPAKALAVRKAVADLVDREQIAKNVYLNTYTPVYSQVPAGLMGASDDYKKMYGDGSGGPDLALAKQRLKKAGVDTPVTLNIQYNTDHYGQSSVDEYGLVKDQLEKGGIFKVNLQSTSWDQYNQNTVKHQYPLYQLGWFSDYPDPDNYLNLVYGSGKHHSLLGEENESPKLNKIIEQERATDDKGARTQLIKKAQEVYAQYLPTLPLLQGASIVVAGSDVKGVKTTLDASFRFRVGLLSKAS